MKATELRIGNHIKWNTTKGVVSVIDGDNDMIAINEMAERSTEEFEPIPLTEEWLKRFGFVKVADNCWLVGNGFYIDLKEGRLDSHLVYWIDVKSQDDFIIIEHVHQLQNLYFALTGEELEAK